MSVGRWRIEGSNDRFQWIAIASFHSAEIAQAVFDCELDWGSWHWIRLVDPSGTTQERALCRTQNA